MTMTIVTRNEIGHLFLAAQWTRHRPRNIFWWNEIVINSVLGFDSSHNLDCLLHDFVTSFAHKLVVTKGIEPLSVQCE